MDLDWSTIRDIVVIGYTVWKWRTERVDRDERKQKERLEDLNRKKESSKRSEK